MGYKLTMSNYVYVGMEGFNLEFNTLALSE